MVFFSLLSSAFFTLLGSIAPYNGCVDGQPTNRGKTLIFSFMTPFRFHYTVRSFNDPHTQTQKFKIFFGFWFSQIPIPLSWPCLSHFSLAVCWRWVLFLFVLRKWMTKTWLRCKPVLMPRSIETREFWCEPNVGRLSHVAVVLIAARADGVRGLSPLSSDSWFFSVALGTVERDVTVLLSSQLSIIIIRWSLKPSWAMAHHSSCCILYLHPWTGQFCVFFPFRFLCLFTAWAF